MRKLYYKFVDKWIIPVFNILLTAKLRKLNKYVKGNVLDIGCGEKPYAKLFNMADKIIGTNSSDYYNDLDLIPSETDVICNDGANLPFENGEFDTVLNFQVLPVFEDMNAFFSEIQRVLKPEGVLVLSSDFLYPIWNAPNNYWRTTEYGLDSLARDNGFDVITIEPLGGYYAMKARLQRRFLRTKMASSVNRFKKAKGFMKLALLMEVLLVTLRSFFAPIWLNLYITIMLFFDKIEYDSEFTTGYVLVARKKC